MSYQGEPPGGVDKEVLPPSSPATIWTILFGRLFISSLLTYIINLQIQFSCSDLRALQGLHVL
jgi:hypothetical protein